MESVVTNNQDFLAGLVDKTVLIAGVSGYVGTALRAVMDTIPCRIIALSGSGTQSSFTGPKTIELNADLSQWGAWSAPLQSHQPDIIFNLAAYEHRRGSPHSPEIDFAVNAASVLDLLESCRRLELKPQIVLASSSNLVGCPARLPVDETFPDEPLTLYAIHKLAAERYLHYYATTFGIPGVALRFANIYGSAAEGKHEIAARAILNRIMLQALKGGPLQLFANQHCRRDFVYITDVVHALCAAAVCPNLRDGSRCVIGSEEGLTLREIVYLIAEKVETMSGWRPEIQHLETTPLEAVEFREFIANCTRMRTATGWAPQVGLIDGIERTLHKFKEHNQA